MYMTTPLKLEIDSNTDEKPYLYRYHIEYEGQTHGSCFCYDTFDEAIEKALDIIGRLVDK